MKDRDTLRRFLFESMGVRGEIVSLDATWRAVQAIHPYPPPVAAQLGCALSAVALLSTTIKLAGSLILQIQGEGPLTTLVAQASHRRTLRGLAQWRDEVPAGDLRTQYGEGRLVMTAEAPGGERYQGIVALEGENLAQALETYLARSAQLPTRLWLASDAQAVAGLLLQRLPDAPSPDDDWERVLMLASTLTDEELLGLPQEELLVRLFHEERVRVFEPEPVAFRCNCSKTRMEDILRALGRKEVESILAEQGEIQADCDFCNRRYRFDAVDVATLFASSAVTSSDATH